MSRKWTELVSMPIPHSTPFRCLPLHFKWPSIHQAAAEGGAMICHSVRLCIGVTPYLCPAAQLDGTDTRPYDATIMH